VKVCAEVDIQAVSVHTQLITNKQIRYEGSQLNEIEAWMSCKQMYSKLKLSEYPEIHTFSG
jgi:hypothetical protein